VPVRDTGSFYVIQMEITQSEPQLEILLFDFNISKKISNMPQKNSVFMKIEN
jgi:hypothetical protein